MIFSDSRDPIMIFSNSRDPIFFYSREPFMIFSDSRTRFSILGTRTGSLKHLKKHLAFAIFCSKLTHNVQYKT